ncbi:MAG: hypothetical protein IPJ19_06425 [Planctomycetes bacterium]|nr:hypothetical protein [Planctomycetota bacterium]
MRKWFLFLVLFALGIAVLLWVTRREGAQTTRRNEPHPEVQDPGRFTSLPGEDGQGGTGLHLDGALSITKRTGSGDTLHTEYTLTASDVDFLEADTYDLHDVVVRVFDPVTDKERAKLTSPLTRMRLHDVNGKTGLADDEPVRFNNAQLLLEDGGPIVPVTLSMPLLEWTPATGELRSSDRVNLEGRGLSAEGSGLEASLNRDRRDLRLLRDGSVDLTLDTGAHAKLRSTGAGPFEIRRVAGSTPGAEAIEVEVSEGARLDIDRISGTEPVDISARTLVLGGARREAGASGFLLTRAEANGEVESHSRGDTFKAQKANWTFDAEGRLVHAHLEDKVELGSADGTFHSREAGFDFGPNGRLLESTLSGDPAGEIALDGHLPESAPELAGARAKISGAGPLTLDVRNGTNVKLEGPARLEIESQSFVLEARKLLSGNVDAGKKTGTFEADEQAVATWHESEIHAPRLDLRYALGTERGDVVGAISTGRTTGKLAMRAGEPIELVAQDGLEARSTDRKLTIPLARGVDLTRKGTDGFHASAKSVRDFDHDAQTFSAEGDVGFENARGKGHAERVIARGPEQHDLFGSARSPARWEAIEAPSGRLLATAQAVEIHVEESSLDATGAVTAQFEATDAHYRLECQTLHAERVPEEGVLPARWRGVRVHSQGAVRLRSESQERNLSLDCADLALAAVFAGAPDSIPPPELEQGTLEANGSVQIGWVQAGELQGEGEHFRVDSNGKGKLWAPEGGHVRARGKLPGRDQPYQLDADWIEFDKHTLDAQHAAIALIETQGGKPSSEDELLLELSCEKLHADEHTLHLQGQAHAVGRSRSGQPWSIDADDVLLQGELRPGGSVAEDLANARAEGAVRVQLGEKLELRGDKLEGKNGQLRVEGHPAVLEVEDAIWESAWIQYDPVNMLLETARGTIRARDQRDPQAWTVEYESLRPFDQEDTSILVLHNPVFRQQRKELRATWALFWIDREEWRANTRGAMRRRLGDAKLHLTAPEPPQDKLPSRDLRVRFRQLREDPLAQILSEVYVEGEVELVERDERDPLKSQRRGRADAFYLDLRQGRGWLQNADVVLDMPFRGRGLPQSVRAKAGWMRVASDFSLLADDAVLTSCEYDEPHYMIETSHLRVSSAKGGGGGWDIEAHGNALRFGKGGLTIPLPTIDTPTDDRGNPFFITNLFAGNSSQFGASVRATVNLALGSLGFGFGKLFGGLLRVPTTDLQGHWKFDVGILGTRGLLLGAGLEISIKDRLKLEADYSFIPDNREDRGLVRVPEGDRSLLRQWFRLRARRFFGPTEWLDLAVSWQSDPGMQSEFFERDYLSYEQKDVFLHWRRAEGSTYWSASAKPQIENRTETLELPKAGWYLGRHPVFRMGGIEVLYSAQASAGYFERREGDAAYYPPFADGLGQRDIARVDTEQRLEAPFPIGVAGIRLSPFTAVRGSAWSASSNGYEDAARGVATAGIDAGTTFWKRYAGGTLSTLTPRVSVHGDVVDDQRGPLPVPIDGVEEDQSGTFLDLGLRARWWQPRSKEHLDVDLSARHAWNMDTQPDGWRPVGVLGEFLTFVAGVPVGLTHDARYSVEDGETVYSRSFLGFRPFEHWGIELGYHHARDEFGDRLYDAASINTRYRATKKWELELSETLDLERGTGLDNEFTLRRLGHDFVMEIGVGFRAGEGTNFGLRLTPNLAYRRSSLGLIDRWLGQDE